jgi:hypothetical protein
MKLPSFASDRTLEIAPVLSALLLWSGLVYQAKRAPSELSLAVLIGSIFVLVAGMNSRLRAFLHTTKRLEWLPLPLSPADHWRDATALYHRSLALQCALAACALGSAQAFAAWQMPGPALSQSATISSWLTLAATFAAASLAEPFAAALGTLLGRRVGPESAAREWQNWISGGVTVPEAAIHLYTPSLGLTLACVVALPIEVVARATLATGNFDSRSLLFTALPTLVVLALRVAAPHLFAFAVYVAVPTLHEVLRTLRGALAPLPRPRWIDWIWQPVVQIWATQCWRLIPAPYFRIIFLATTTIWCASRDGLSPVSFVIGAASLLLWWTPFFGLHTVLRRLSKSLGALPVAWPRPTLFLTCFAIVPTLPLCVVLLLGLAARSLAFDDPLPSDLAEQPTNEFQLAPAI